MTPLSQPHVWNLVSPGYVEHNVAVFEGFAEQATSIVGLAPTQRILDVATGPGSLALRAAPRAGRVDAVDFSPVMLTALQARLNASGLQNVYAVEGDGQALPYSDGVFDAAFSMFGLMFFPDRAQGFRELRRVLKPGGRAAIASWAPMHDVKLFNVLFEALFDAAPQLQPSEPPAPAPLSDTASIRAEMSAAGFDVEVFEMTQALEAPSMSAYAAGARTAFAPICLMEEQLGDAFEAVWESVTRRLIEVFGDGPLRLPMTALLGVGTAI
jgi:ubiquinone/menaquinone biosynthesis C-methylase UbiE